MNIKPRLLILALLLATTIVTVSAQHQHRGECGVTYEMEQQLPVYSKKDVQLFKEANSERFASINIPVMFHTVANSVGEGRVKRKDILKSLCRMNNDYAEHGVVYYLKDGGFNELDNSNIFSNVSMNGDLVQTFKDGAAVDIFITENADTGSSLGTTLGFYSPGGDYIIIRKKEMADSSGTMSHEVGHYFSLRHPHSGWDQPYDIGTYGNSVPFNTVPGTDLR